MFDDRQRDQTLNAFLCWRTIA